MTPTQLAETVPAQTLAKALLEAEDCMKADVNALEDYIQTLEAYGHSLFYGRSVLDNSKTILAQIQRIKKGDMV